MEYRELIHSQRAFFRSGRPAILAFRKRQLTKLYVWIEKHESDIEKALKADLCKSGVEAYTTEIGIVKEEIRYALRHLEVWARPRVVPTPLTQFPAKSVRYPQGYGVVLIMSPWNYPFQLTVAPLVGAISAGNCAVVKPSAYSPHTSALLKRMMSELFKQEYVAVIEGGRKENEFLLNEKFDYIFFTGSVNVGKLVMEKAVAHLTPVSLELGGKSPCIVDETADIRLAAKRIIWGKLLNAGQTCVAPDYILVQKNVKDRLIKQMVHQIYKMYGKEPLLNENYPRIVNEKHFERVNRLLDSGKKVCGGGSSKSSLKIAPTILEDITWESPVMQEEIFGPILPVMTFYDIREVIEMVNARPSPLALYYFTKDKTREQQIIRSISYGGGCINDTVVHLATSYMPFGGVGNSGMGSYHGKESFDTFTHYKSVMKKSNILDIPIRYAPFKESRLKWIKKIQK